MLEDNLRSEKVFIFNFREFSKFYMQSMNGIWSLRNANQLAPPLGMFREDLKSYASVYIDMLHVFLPYML